MNDFINGLISLLDWTDDRSDVWNEMETVIFTPYYSNDIKQQILFG